MVPLYEDGRGLLGVRVSFVDVTPLKSLQEDQMMIGRGDIDAAVLRRLAVGRMRGGQPAGRVRISGSRLRPREIRST